MLEQNDVINIKKFQEGAGIWGKDTLLGLVYFKVKKKKCIASIQDRFCGKKLDISKRVKIDSSPIWYKLNNIYYYITSSVKDARR